MNKFYRFFLQNDTKKLLSYTNDGIVLAFSLIQRHRLSLFFRYQNYLTSSFFPFWI